MPSILVGIRIRRRLLQQRPTLFTMVSALVMSGLLICMGRNWCLSVRLPLTHPWHLPKAAVLTIRTLLWERVGPRTPFVPTVFLSLLVEATARTLLTNRTMPFVVPILSSRFPICRLNRLWNRAFVIRSARLSRKTLPLRSFVGIRFPVTCLVTFLVTVAPLMFVLLTR